MLFRSDIQRGKIEYFKKMTDYANKNNNLNGFDFSEVYSPVTTPSSATGGWSAKPISK